MTMQSPLRQTPYSYPLSTLGRHHHDQPIVPSLRTISLSISITLIVILVSMIGLWPTPAPAAQVAPADEFCSKHILFVGAERPPLANDEELYIYLTLLGHNVDVLSASEATTTDANGKDLIIISESVEPAEVNTKFRDVAVPILTWEGWLQDDLGMVPTGTDTPRSPSMDGSLLDKDRGTYGEVTGQVAVHIADATHPLAAGLAGDVITVSSPLNKFHWGKPNANAAVVAHAITDTTRVMIYAYEQGNQMIDRAAPARRLFIHNATAPDLTAAGWALFTNAVYWALECPADSITPTVTATITEPATTTPTPTATNTPTATSTPIGTVPHTPTMTATTTPLAPLTVTPTATFVSSNTPTATATEAAIATTTATATFTATPTQLSQLTSTPTGTPTPTITPGVEASLRVEKRDILFIDSTEDGLISIGDTLLYTVRIYNDSDNIIQELVIDDELDDNTTLITGSTQSSLGSIERGNQSGDTAIQIKVDTLAPQTTLQISYQTEIQPTGNVAVITNQATVRFNDPIGSPGGQRLLSSDDPDTPAPNDATVTPLTVDMTRVLYLPFVTR